MSTYEAKDLLRASRLPMLEQDNKHVASDLAKVKSGLKLSPILLVRGRIDKNREPGDRRRVPPHLRELLHRRELPDSLPTRRPPSN